MSYPNPYNSYAEEWYRGGDPLLGPVCPVCNAPRGQCVGGTGPKPLTYPPVDVPPDPDPDTPGGLLRMYRVTQFGYTSLMQLNDADAARYGDAAVLMP